MEVTTSIRLDLTRVSAPAVVHAVQGDGNTRYISAEIYDNGVEWNPPDGLNIAVAFKKPDGTKGLYDTLPDEAPAITVSGNTITAILAPQVLTVAGTVDAAIVLQDESLDQLTTFPFLINVAENPAAGESVSNDYYRYTTLAEINEAINELWEAVNSGGASAIVTSASGSIVAVNDSSESLIKGLALFGKSTQNGTPTFNAPIAISSPGTDGSIDFSIYGKNLFDGHWEKGKLNSGGPVADSSGSHWITSSFIPFDRALKFSAEADAALVASYRLYCYDENKRYVGLALKYVFNELGGSAIDARTKYVRIYATLNSPVEDINTAISRAMITFATDGIYEAYKEPQILPVSTPGGLYGVPVSSDGNYIDSSGRWVCDEIDFEKEEKTQKIKSIILGERTWYAGSLAGRFFTFLDDAIVGSEALCSHFKAVAQGANTDGLAWFQASGERVIFVVNAQAYETADAFAAAAKDIQLVYQSKTQETALLSSEEIAAASALRTYKPYTTALAEGAGINIEYVADTKAYIDNKFAELAAVIVSNA